MDLIFALIIFIGTMTICLITGTSMVIALLAGYICFIFVGLHRGHKVQDLMKMSIDGMKESFIVINILFLIGILTATWRTDGTILFFVYYGIKLITPRLFVLITFIITCLLSYALGTSFGVASTVGVILMALARSGGVNEVITAGAIMSGIYFGDRCAPASSSANLVAAITHTDLYDNVRHMLKTGWIPVGISFVFYGILSFRNPIQGIDRDMMSAIEKDFNMSFWIVIPAVLMLVLPVFKIDVKLAMISSIVSAFIITVTLQGMNPLKLVRCCIFGYYPEESSLGAILNGGGLISMIDIMLILAISCTYSAIFEGTGMLDGVLDKVEFLVKKIGRFQTTALLGVMFCFVFCNQTIATLMSSNMLTKPYENTGGTKKELAIDIENSTIVVAGLVPWCIACSVPLEMMGVGISALPYSIFLYAIPICYLFTKRKK